MAGLTKEQGKTICGKKLILVEGPSGAGKSTLLEKLAELPHSSVISGSLGKRKFKTHEAGMKSFQNDVFKIQSALMKEEPIIFIDRCFISQMVYHAIRTDREPNIHRGTHEHFLDLTESLERDLAWRLQRKPREIEIVYLFLVPDVKVLNQRRETGGKEYPNRAETEIYCYKLVSNHLVMAKESVLRPQYNTNGDTNYIYRSFKYWLRAYPHLTFVDLWRSFITLPEDYK